MNEQRKPRRVRMAQCQTCGFAFKVQRASKEDRAEGINIQQCPNCFIIMNGNDLRTVLEEAAAATGSL